MEYSIPHSIEQFLWNIFDGLFLFQVHLIIFLKKSSRDGGKKKRKTTRATLGAKKEIIAEHRVRVCDLASMYDMQKSTISISLRNKEMIKADNVTTGFKVISKQRQQTIEEVEKLSLVIINEKLLKEDCLSEAFICEKTLDIYGGENSNDFDFKASRGWFEKSFKRCGIHSVLRH